MSEIVLPSLLPGTYIVAVSGGVDSMALLDFLYHQPDIRLIVAHVDHGIRHDSSQDAALVAGVAAELDIPFEQTNLQLGPGASEERARIVRYEFLRYCRKKYNADAIITAHHEDDVIETIIINIMRGTGWRGLVSLRSTPHLLRPFLSIRKAEIIDYANARGLQWREDSTNKDIRYLRNYIRQNVIPKLDDHSRRELLMLRAKQVIVREKIEAELNKSSEVFCVTTDSGGYVIDRYVLIMLPRAVGIELLQHSIERVSGKKVLNSQAESLLIFTKAARPGKKMIPQYGVVCSVTDNSLIVEST